MLIVLKLDGSAIIIFMSKCIRLDVTFNSSNKYLEKKFSKVL